MIRSPQNAAEWDTYYALRYQILRAPWKQAPGSEKTPDENRHQHFAYFDENNQIIGVLRLDCTTDHKGQIRFMAIALPAQNQGIGRALMLHAEERAKKMDLSQILLHARESALGFYEKLGYSYMEKSHLLFNEIQHHLMTKAL